MNVQIVPLDQNYKQGNDLVDKKAEVNVDEIASSVIQKVRYLGNGIIYGLPIHYDQWGVIYYDSDMFSSEYRSVER